MSEERREALELIEEYLSEVREHLPEDISDDVVEELRTHIIDECSEMGGLTVRNVYRVIRKLGDPRELASKYVVGRKKKVLSFEFGISEDLYPYFVQISFWIAIILIAVYAFRITYVAFRYAVSFSIIYIPILIAELLVSIAVTIILLYLIMSFFSSNPDLKMILQKILREIFGEEEAVRRKYLKRKERREAKREMKEIRLEKKAKITLKKKEAKPLTIPVRQVSFLTRLSTLIVGILQLIIAYAFYVIRYYLEFNWLSLILINTIIAFTASFSMINMAHFFYMTYTDSKSYIVQVIKAFLWLVFIPWLMLANIYTQDIQIPTISNELFINEDYEHVLSYITLQPISNEMILLAKILSLLFIVIIVVNAIIVALKYSRTIPKKKAEEILLGFEKNQ